MEISIREQPYQVKSSFSRSICQYNGPRASMESSAALMMEVEVLVDEPVVDNPGHLPFSDLIRTGGTVGVSIAKAVTGCF